MCTGYFTLQLKQCSQWWVTVYFQINLNEDTNKTVKQEIRSRKTQIVCILKSFSKHLCWHDSCVASKIPSHDTFPNEKKKKKRNTTWHIYLAKAFWKPGSLTYKHALVKRNLWGNCVSNTRINAQVVKSSSWSFCNFTRQHPAQFLRLWILSCTEQGLDQTVSWSSLSTQIIL